MIGPEGGTRTSGGEEGAEAAVGEPLDPSAAPGIYCPFLTSIDLADRVQRARLRPDTANRCLSTGEPAAPSARDQSTLCLTAAHERCTRYVRATARRPEPMPPPTRGSRISPPIVAAAGVLGLAALLAGVSLAANGDLSVGVRSPVSPSSSAPVAEPATATPTPLPAVTSTPSIPATEAPSTSPAVAATARSSPIPTATPRKYVGLTPCPGRSDCYIYVVKRGDSLVRIAARYGLTLDAVLARNPSIKDAGLVYLGQKIRLPTPTK